MPQKSFAQFTPSNIEDILEHKHGSPWLKYRALCARVASSQVFELFNACVILVNAVVLGLNWCVAHAWRIARWACVVHCVLGMCGALRAGHVWHIVRWACVVHCVLGMCGALRAGHVWCIVRWACALKKVGGVGR